MGVGKCCIKPVSGNSTVKKKQSSLLRAVLCDLKSKDEMPWTIKWKQAAGLFLSRKMGWLRRWFNGSVAGL
jgi:hypothetical protein